MDRPVCSSCKGPTKRVDFFGELEPPLYWCSACMEATPAPRPRVQRITSELEVHRTAAHERRVYRRLSFAILALTLLGTALMVYQWG